MRKLLTLLVVVLLCCTAAIAQVHSVTGTVTDDKGNPIEGASITIKGSRIGTAADVKGYFKINAKDGDVLVVSSTGFANKEVKVSGNAVLVSLSAGSNVIDEVVVTALGVKRSSKATGYSVATVPTAELTQARVTNVANGLSGKVSGLQINTVNNGVSADTRIVLRGERSILGNNQALIVIDNVPVSADYLNSLNPDDIENVTILKGANAAALYGSDASNGVILVTSKKGVRAKPSVTVTSTVTLEKVGYFPKLNDRFGAASTEPDSLNPKTGYFGRIPYENQMYGPEYNGQMVALGYAKRFYRADGTAFDSTQMIPYTYQNPLKKFFQTGVTYQNGVSYQAGDANGSFFMSGQFNNTTGTIPKDQAKRYSVRMGSTRTYGKFSSQFSIGYTKYTTNVAGVDYNQGRPVYWNVLNTPGEVPIKNYSDLSQPFANENNWYNAYYPNPYWQIENSRVMTNQDDILGSLQMDLKATKWLNFTYRLGVTARNYQQKNTIAGVTFSEYEISDPVGAGNSASGAPNGIKPLEFDRLYESFIVQSDFLINLEHSFVNNNLNAKLVLGNSINKNNYRNLQTGNNQMEIPGLYNVSNVIGIPTVSEGKSNSGKIGAFGSLQLAWKNYLFVEITGRNDWVSVLAPENRSFFYPGINGSFVFTDAFKSLKGNLPWLSYGKVFAGLTKVGNVSLSPYALSNTFSQTNGFPYNNLTGFSLGNTLANENIKPEMIKSREFGIQLGLLKNRVNVGVTYYDEDASNQTVPIQISSASGFTGTNQNVGNVSNSGWEFDLKLTPLVNLGPVKFNLAGNLALYKSKVDQIDPKIKQVFIGGFTTGAGVYTVEGQSLRILKVTDYNRDSLGRVIVDANTGRPSIDNVTGVKNVGQSTPSVILGLTPSFEYKGITLGIVAEYRGGYVVYQNIGNAMAFTGVSAITTATGRQRFIYPNSVINVGGKYVPNTTVALNNAADGGSFWTSSSGFRGAGTNFITSGDFWKIREVSLSYNVPLKGNITKTIKKIGIGFVARNLFTFLPKDNVYADPEYSVLGTGNAQGVNNENLSPPTRIFGGTLTVGF